MTKKTLVIIGARGIGDLIYHLPLLRSLYKTYNKKVHILSNHVSQAKDVFINENFYEEIRYFDNTRYNIFQTIRNIVNFRNLINSYNVDQVVLTSNATRLTLPVLLSKISKKIILGQGKLLFNKDKSLNHLTISERLMIYTNNLQLPKKENNFLLKKGSLEKGIRDKKNYFISIDSHHDHNNWDKEYYIRLIEKIKNPNKIYINFSPDKEYFLKFFPKKFFQSEIFEFTYKKKISEIIEIINQCDVVIGNESGPVCLASSLNKVVHAIYLPVHTKPESRIINSNNKYYNAKNQAPDEIINKIISSL